MKNNAFLGLLYLVLLPPRYPALQLCVHCGCCLAPSGMHAQCIIMSPLPLLLPLSRQCDLHASWSAALTAAACGWTRACVGAAPTTSTPRTPRAVPRASSRCRAQLESPPARCRRHVPDPQKTTAAPCDRSACSAARSRRREPVATARVSGSGFGRDHPRVAAVVQQAGSPAQLSQRHR
jgi:hypothetical protein